jgi:hypothetical protein
LAPRIPLEKITIDFPKRACNIVWQYMKYITLNI